MNWGRALVAGALGALAMTAAFAGLRAAGLTEMNNEMALGALVTQSTAGGAWVAGLAVHLTFGGLFGLVYGAVMEAFGRRGWPAGVLTSCPHSLLSGILQPVMMSMHPEVLGGERLEPAAYNSHLGAWGVVTFFGAHLAYGAVVGSIYRLRGGFIASTSPAEPLGRRPPTAIHTG